MVDEADIAKAKELAAGPLGEKMAKFPLLFAMAAYFGQRPSKSRPTEVRNGTITLADLGKGPLAITCHHVITAYRERRAALQKVIFQIGDVEIDPVDQLIDEDERLDLATIRLTESQVKAITSQGEIGSCVFQPVSWPPPLPKEGEYVAFGGFPGTLRSVISFDELDFGSWSSGASQISSVSEFQFASVFEREFWIQSFGNKHHMDLNALGGMSGGPAFLNRGLYWDLVGIVSQYHETYDTVLFASVRGIYPDGTIGRPPV